MKEIEAIRNHPLFREQYENLKQTEKDRRFCCHQMEHLLDVARIAYILNLEQHLNIRKEVIYAAAILHDIGKNRQYTEGIPHEKTSAQIGELILGDLPAEMFSKEEKRNILQAILGHRRMREEMEPLERLLYTSDKASRKCFDCEAEKVCNWNYKKKNFTIEV